MKRINFKNFFEYMFMIMICTLILVPNGVYAKTIGAVNEYNSNRIIAEDERILSEYVTIGKDNVPYFDVDKAIRNGESKDIIDSGKLFNDFSNAMSTDNYNEEALRAMTAPIWGNWCGPGYGSGAPIDLLDEGCRQHDNCYVHGGNNCNCNKRLINYINKNINRMTGGQKKMASVVRWWFKLENFRKGCK